MKKGTNRKRLKYLEPRHFGAASWTQLYREKFQDLPPFTSRLSLRFVERPTVTGGQPYDLPSMYVSVEWLKARCFDEIDRELVKLRQGVEAATADHKPTKYQGLGVVGSYPGTADDWAEPNHQRCPPKVGRYK